MLTRILALSLLITLPAFAAPLTDAETTALLEKIAAAKKDQVSLQVNFHEVKKRKITTRNVENDGTIWLRLPNKFRREDKGSGTVNLTNGKEVWMYYPAFDRAEVYKIGTDKRLDSNLAAITSGFDLANLSNLYHVTAEAEGKGWVLTLKPKKPALKKTIEKLVLTLNAEFDITNTLLQLPNGDQIVSTLSGHRYSAVPESKFEFTPGPNTKVTSMFEKAVKD